MVCKYKQIDATSSHGAQISSKHYIIKTNQLQALTDSGLLNIPTTTETPINSNILVRTAANPTQHQGTYRGLGPVLFPARRGPCSRRAWGGTKAIGRNDVSVRRPRVASVGRGPLESSLKLQATTGSHYRWLQVSSCYTPLGGYTIPSPPHKAYTATRARGRKDNVNHSP